MRSIGKVKIKKLKRIVNDELARDPGATADGIIMNLIPSEWFDTWEGAWAEIHNLVWDEVMKNIYDRA